MYYVIKYPVIFYGISLNFLKLVIKINSVKATHIKRERESVCELVYYQNKTVASGENINRIFVFNTIIE